MRNVSLLAVWMAIVFALPVSAEPFDPSQFPSTLNAQGEELTLNGIALITHPDMLVSR